MFALLFHTIKRFIAYKALRLFHCPPCCWFELAEYGAKGRRAGCACGMRCLLLVGPQSNLVLCNNITAAALAGISLVSCLPAPQDVDSNLSGLLGLTELGCLLKVLAW